MRGEVSVFAQRTCQTERRPALHDGARAANTMSARPSSRSARTRAGRRPSASRPRRAAPAGTTPPAERPDFFEAEAPREPPPHVSHPDPRRSLPGFERKETCLHARAGSPGLRQRES
jgi:hypothetical protein